MTPKQLQKLVQSRLLSGELPREQPPRLWAGPGSGAACAVCGATISAQQLEYEIEFGSSATTRTVLRFHVACHSAWTQASDAGSYATIA